MGGQNRPMACMLTQYLHLLQECIPAGCVPSAAVAAGSARDGEVSATHTPVDRMTDACENITLPQLRCGR